MDKATRVTSKRQSNAARQRALKAQRAAEGLVQVNVWLPKAAAPEFKLAAARILENPDLRIGSLVNAKTGRFASVTHRRSETTRERESAPRPQLPEARDDPDQWRLAA